LQATDPFCQSQPKILSQNNSPEGGMSEFGGIKQGPPEITGPTDMDAPYRCWWRLQQGQNAQSSKGVDAALGQGQLALVETGRDPTSPPPTMAISTFSDTSDATGSLKSC